MRRRAFLAGGLAAGLCPATDASETHIFTRGSWQALRQSRRGQPALVHFWGLVCGPCIVELPAWGDLHRRLPTLDLILVAADPVSHQPDDYRTTLAKAGLDGVESWVFQNGAAERLYFEVDPQWQGELPRTVLLPREGPARQLTGAVDFDAITAWYNAERSAS